MIGYIICETSTAPRTPRVMRTSESRVSRVMIETVLQEADIKNRNGRIYPKKIIDEGLQSEFVKERLRTNTFYGEAGHPLDPDIKRQLHYNQNNISHIVKDFWWEGNLLKGKVEAANTAVGNDFEGLILQGCRVAFSLRAIGNIDKRGVIQSPLTIFCYDWVVHPSHRPAYMSRILVESDESQIEQTDCFKPILVDEELNRYLKASSKHIRMISESLNIDNWDDKDLYLSERADRVYIEDNNELIAVKLEDVLSRELRHHLSNIKLDESNRLPLL